MIEELNDRKLTKPCFALASEKAKGRPRWRVHPNRNFSLFERYWPLRSVLWIHSSFTGVGLKQRLRCPGWLDRRKPFEDEDDALTNIGAVISDPFELVRDPEPVRHALDNERVLF